MSYNFQKLTPKQREVLGLIAINQDLGHHPKTVAALLHMGMIVESEEQWRGNGRSPIERIPMKVKRYAVPIPVHMAWCAWCATQEVGADDE